MLDFNFSSTGPELQITLKIVRRFHVFPKITCNFYLISSSLFFCKTNIKHLSTGLYIRTWQEIMRLAGTGRCCNNVHQTRSRWSLCVFCVETGLCPLSNSGIKDHCLECFHCHNMLRGDWVKKTYHRVKICTSQGTASDRPELNPWFVQFASAKKGLGNDISLQISGPLSGGTCRTSLASWPGSSMSKTNKKKIQTKKRKRVLHTK